QEESTVDWHGRKVLLTGGTSFIGSHLLDVLVQRGATVRVMDDLSSGKLENIRHHLSNGKVEFVQADLKEPGTAERAVEGMSVVLTLRSYYRDWGMQSASCRYFTVYGERGHENHAVIAMIARAFVGQDPFEVWGSGEQIRNWTHVNDIVQGTVLAAEKIEDGTAVNLGTMERTRVMDAVKEVLAYTGHEPEIEFRPDMPTGPLNRVADNSLARKLLNWEPEVRFREGLHRTIDWYFSTKNREEVRAVMAQSMTERRASFSESARFQRTVS